MKPDGADLLLVRSALGPVDGVWPLSGGVALKITAVQLGSAFQPSSLIRATGFSAVEAVFYHLRLVYQLCPFLGMEELGTVTHAPVSSTTQKHTHTTQTPVLKRLHWSLICRQAHFKALVNTFKALNGFGPQYLKVL